MISAFFKRMRVIKTAILSLVILTAAGTLNPPKSEAMLVALVATSGDAEDAVKSAIVCGFAWTIVLLPICFLNENAASSATPQTEQDLLANGYSPTEARLILSDAAQLSSQANRLGLAISVRRNETRASLEHDVRQIHPTASRLFINFLADQANLL